MSLFKSRWVIPVSLLLCIAFSCQNNSPKSKASDNDSNAFAPVETKQANSRYSPAFKGQTRIAGIKTQTPINISLIDSTLHRPWGICSLPDGRLLISEKTGEMRILSLTGGLSKTITGLPKVVDKGQGGLLDVNVDPDFAHNKIIYWDYAEQTPQGTVLAVAKGKLSADETKIENARVIYRATPAFKGKLQYGSRILFDKEGNLFVSTGERSQKEIRIQAQWLNSSLGKIIHISKEGKPVTNGPFAYKPNARPELYAYGLRNPEGMAWNPETGELWEAEFGPRGGDELNIIRPGKNYGWPIITYGMEYSGEKVGEGIQQKVGMEQPIYYWDPVVSPSGIHFYFSDSISEWKGDLFVACLSGSHIIRLAIKNNKVVGEERLLENMGERFRAITQGKDGALYTITDKGNLYRIGRK